MTEKPFFFPEPRETPAARPRRARGGGRDRRRGALSLHAGKNAALPPLSLSPSPTPFSLMS